MQKFHAILMAAVLAAPLALAGGPALAKDTVSDASGPVGKMLTQLQSEGYKIDETSKTLLGRTKIEASKDFEQREIVMNPDTGEILRDRVREDKDFDGDFNEGDD